MKSILKELKISINLENSFSLKKFIDISSLKKKLEATNTSTIINNTRINKVNGLFYVKSFKNMDTLLKSFIDLNLEISPVLKYVESIMSDKEIILKKIDDVLFFSYIDLFFNYYLLKSNVDNLELCKFYLLNINKIVGKEVIIKGDREHQTSSTWIQSTLLQTAMGSIEWVRDKSHPYVSYNVNKYLNEINAKLVEIPKDYDLCRLESSLKEIAYILDEFKINKRDFIIRFRKIKKLKKTGLFIASANTIILDPRDTDSFKHELGHYIYENKLSYFTNNKKINYNEFDKIVKDNINNYINIINKHSIEDYKKESEIFAFNFENYKS